MKKIDLILVLLVNFAVLVLLFGVIAVERDAKNFWRDQYDKQQKFIDCMDRENQHLGLHQDVRERCNGKN